MVHFGPRSLIACRPMLHITRNYNIPINAVKRSTYISKGSTVYLVTDSKLVTQGRRGSHYNLEMINVTTHQKITERHNSGSSVEAVEVTESRLSFLYATPTDIVLMDDTTFVEHTLPKSLIPEKVLAFLNPGMVLTVSSTETTALSITVPVNATYTVKDTSPSTSSEGRTASKSAILDNGQMIRY